MSNTFSSIDWDLYAQGYDVLNILKPYRSLLSQVMRKIVEQRKLPILDAGCGTGNLTYLLQEYFGSTDVFGIDSSNEMLARAKRKCLGSNFEYADLSNEFPFTRESFGAITCINVLYTVKNPLVVLKEFHRVLRSDGLLVLVTPKSGYENGLILKAHCESDKPDEYWRGVHTSPEQERILVTEAITDRSAVEQMIFVAEVNRRIAQHVQFSFFTEEELMHIMRTAGFETQEYCESYAQQAHFFVARKS